MNDADTSEELDVLGFYVHRTCPHCEAHLYKSQSGGAICLNACNLPVWQYRAMNQGLREAQARIEARDKAEKERLRGA